MAFDTDIYMTSDNDIGIMNGDIRLIHDADNIVQTAVNNMCTVYGELDNDPERGNSIYGARIKFTDSGMKEVAFECKKAILQDSRVASVISVIANYNNEFECTVTFRIKDTQGRVIDGNTSIVIGGV